MGANAWQAEAGWPVPGTVVTPYYLSSAPGTRSASGVTGRSPRRARSGSGGTRLSLIRTIRRLRSSRSRIAIRHPGLHQRAARQARGRRGDGHGGAGCVLRRERHRLCRQADRCRLGRPFVEPGERDSSGPVSREHGQAGLHGAGHRIRLWITGSKFSLHDRNLNTGGDNVTETTWSTAVNTIHHGGATVSRLLLPVIPSVRTTP